MPALQSVALLDREATPVSHTFLPNDRPNGVATVTRSSGVAVGDETLTVSSKWVGDRRKARIVLAVPVVQTQTINGISTPTVVRTAYGEINFTFDRKSTAQERKNLVGMVQDALAPSKTLVNGAVVDMEGVW